jgi:hypothetical protein
MARKYIFEEMRCAYKTFLGSLQTKNQSGDQGTNYED